MYLDQSTQWRTAGNGYCRADDNKSCIRAVRIAQGMQSRELAAIMGVSAARISVLERDERRGAVTLKMMQKAAEALGCDFVYTLVPKNTLAQQPKPRIQLDSSQLRGDAEQQRRMLRQAYDRRMTRVTRD